MKTVFALLASVFAVSTALASHPAPPTTVQRLTREEMALIEAFRANPEPFRAVLHGEPIVQPPPAPVYIGPRDIIDVTVSGGLIVFGGKRRAYDPATIRLVRGQPAEMVFKRQGKAQETAVRVVYLADGLHFDVPEFPGGSRALPRGFIVVPENPGWRTGEPYSWTGHLDSSRSASEAQNVTFTIRYVSRR